MQSNVGVKFFKGFEEVDSFNDWSERHPKIEIKDIKTGYSPDGIPFIIILYVYESNIITLPVVTT